MQKIWDKYKEAISYLFWGFVSFIISIASFYFLANICCLQALIANVISWIICVLFAYATNRTLVFKSQNNDMRSIGREFIQFISARVGTLILEELILFIGITCLHGDNMIVKLIGQVFVIILNYVLSKIWIFKKK